jgi:hypothetical protein
MKNIKGILIFSNEGDFITFVDETQNPQLVQQIKAVFLNLHKLSNDLYLLQDERVVVMEVIYR